MIRALLLDLDNTLYPASASMEDDIVDRMNRYAAGVVGLSVEKTRELRRERMPRYGTTLEWLMADYGYDDPEAYFAAVHPAGEEDVLSPDPALKPFLDSIDLPKYIFTNAPMEHAERVLRRLGVESCFRRVFDVRFNGLKGKPDRAAVERVIAATGREPAETLFADDVPRYVRGFADCGGTGVLVDWHGAHADSGLPTIKTVYGLPAFLPPGAVRPPA